MASEDLASLADPRVDAKTGYLMAIGFGAAILLSATVFRLDAAAFATGEVVADARRTIVQHREGGNVGAMLVREGSVVRVGDVLIRLDAAAVTASTRTLAEQGVQLLARRARLAAEVQGRRIVGPARFDLGNEGAVVDPAVLDAAMRAQERELAARWATLDARVSALGQRVLRSQDQQRGQNGQARSVVEQIRLTDEELELLRPLAKVGHVSQTRIRSLERARADLEGQLAAFESGASLSGRDVEDVRLQVLETRQAFTERAAAELAEVETQLADLIPRWHAAQNLLRRTEVRAPIAGTVVGLTVGSLGAVVAPGQTILEIVPTNVWPRIQARVSPSHADDLRIGMPVTVSLPGIHERHSQPLEGRLLRLSARNLVDERTGNSYFLAEISLPDTEIGALQQLRGQGFRLRPGMPAEVSFALRKRSVLSYLVEPLIGSFWSSLGEQ